MPIYEYRCTACNHEFELRQKFSDPPAGECPKCAGAVEKLISSTSFTLKGGGWYDQGYNSTGKEKAPSCPSAGSGGGCAGCPSAA